MLFKRVKIIRRSIETMKSYQQFWAGSKPLTIPVDIS